jgi:DNA-binding NarL/FixJ family response regulator
MSIRLLIADDHPLIRAGLPIMLEGSGIEIVGVLGSAEATEAQIPK